MMFSKWDCKENGPVSAAIMSKTFLILSSVSFSSRSPCKQFLWKLIPNIFFMQQCNFRSEWDDIYKTVTFERKLTFFFLLLFLFWYKYLRAIVATRLWNLHMGEYVAKAISLNSSLINSTAINMYMYV